tara:strand:- start:319 stop:597 length:279 start_codon:yes stop_codon:yes gene_type:complete
MTKNKKYTLDDCVYLCMSRGGYWTFWELQRMIKENTGNFYGEPTISASIRNLRKYEQRTKYNLPLTGEVIDRKRRTEGKGYKYKLIGVENGR